jgi:hypothetical protein
MNGSLSTSKLARAGPQQSTSRSLCAFSIGVLSFGGAVGISSSNAVLSLALCVLFLLMGSLGHFGSTWAVLVLAPLLPLLGVPWPAAAITASLAATILNRRQLAPDAIVRRMVPLPPLRRRVDFRIQSVATVGAIFGAAGWFIANARFTRDPFVMERPAPSAFLIGTCMVVLAVLNAAGEELLWRHHLHDLAVKAGLPIVAIIVSFSCSFGIAHLHGVPSGFMGILGAGFFSMSLTLLRTQYGFMAATLTHFIVDIAVFSAIARNVIFTG